MPRKPKPPHLKVVDGNPGKRPIEKPRTAPSRPIAPAHLSDGAKTEWGYVVPRLDEIGMLNKIDRTALEVYCEAVATHREAVASLRQGGVLVRGDKGRVVKNPAAQIVRDSATTIRLLGAEFGLTPSSRTRMALPDINTSDEELDEILSG